jgi:hypothetical protein
MEDFVSYEIAVKLKEKGFKEQCLAYYSKDSGFYYNASYGSDVENAFKSFNSRPNHICRKRIDAPTISQVLKWLREKKKLHVSIMTFMFRAGWCYEVVRLGENPNLVAAHRNSYSTYEKAAIAGIEYVLDNLI